MDGASEERNERSRIKIAVKENFRHVKRIQQRALRRYKEQQSRILSESPLLAEGDPSEHTIDFANQYSNCATDYTIGHCAESSTQLVDGGGGVDYQRGLRWNPCHRANAPERAVVK